MPGPIVHHPLVSLRDTVQLSIPLLFEYVRVARLTASGLASRLSFDVDEIDDIRIAVDELAGHLVEAAGATGDGELVIEFCVSPECLEIVGRAPARRDPPLEELTRQILSAAVDGYEVTIANGEGRFRCWKQVREPQPDSAAGDL